MVKTIFKELIITLLLILAILLVLGVLFYEYIPSGKLVPEKVAYTTPENVAEEIKSQVAETQPVNIVYKLDDSDLKNAKRTGDYDPGKKNPFAAYEKSAEGTDNTSSGNTSSGTSGGNTNTESGYYPNTGTK